MTVINAWSGAPTPDGFQVIARVVGATVRLAVAADAALTGPSYFTGTLTGGVATFTVTGLSPATRYWYALEVDGSLDYSWTGQAKTAPAANQPASFTFVASSCAGHDATPTETTFWPPDSGVTGVSNHPAFDSMRQVGADFFLHMGDMHYRNIGGNDPALFRQALDDVLAAPRQAALYKSCPLIYMADDHDGGPDNRDKTSASLPAFKTVYRERVPHYPLTDPSGLWQTFVYGRVRFIVTDNRSERDPYTNTDDATKRVLGATQEQWFKNTLLAATEPLIVWVSTNNWHGTATAGSDAWNVYTTERARLSDFITQNRINDRLIMISGDSHTNALDDGRNNTTGSFPELQFSGIDAGYAGIDGLWQSGPFTARGQYGVVQVVDTGDVITVTSTAYATGVQQASLTLPRRGVNSTLVQVMATKALISGTLTSVTEVGLADVTAAPVATWVRVT